MDGFIRNIAGDNCVAACNATNEEVINLAGDQCVIGCPLNAETRNNEDGDKQCICLSGFFEDPDVLTCNSECEDFEFVSLNGKRCLETCADDVNDPNVVTNTAETPGSCECRNGFFPNSAKDACLSDCEINQVINLAGDACIGNTECPTGSTAMSNSEGDQQCMCGDTLKLSSDLASCTTACGDDEFTSLDGKRCVVDCEDEGTGITGNSISFTCVCKDNFLKSSDSKTCETGCPEGEFVSIDKKECTQCLDGVEKEGTTTFNGNTVDGCECDDSFGYLLND